MQIILLTDADVDGAHIRTLLLTFLYRYSRDVFNTGTIYVGVPPLYKLDIGRKSQYCYDEDELQQEIKGRAPGSYQIQRFKVGPSLSCVISFAFARGRLAWSRRRRRCMAQHALRPSFRG